MKVFLSLVLLLLLLPSSVYAQETTTAPTPTSTIKQQKEENKQLLIQNREETKEMRLQNREDFMASKAAIRDQRQDLKALLKQKLAAFKDQVKAERVNRIEALFTTINTNRTAEMLKRLETMENILSKLDTTIADLDKNGKDTVSAKSAVADARTSLDAAKTAVETQSKKDYTITISSEGTVKNDITPVRQTLFTDLQTLNQQILGVRKKVITAIKQTQSLIGETTDGK